MTRVLLLRGSLPRERRNILREHPREDTRSVRLHRATSHPVLPEPLSQYGKPSLVLRHEPDGTRLPLRASRRLLRPRHRGIAVCEIVRQPLARSYAPCYTVSATITRNEEKGKSMTGDNLRCPSRYAGGLTCDLRADDGHTVHGEVMSRDDEGCVEDAVTWTDEQADSPAAV